MSGPGAHPPPEVLEADELPADVAAHVAGCAACRIDRRLLRDREPPTEVPGWDEARGRLAALSRDGVQRALESWSATRSAGGGGTADAPLEVGAVLGDYQVEALLGRGGMATVYVVRHRDRATRHALKVLRSDSATARRLVREGRLQGAVHDPHVVGVDDTIDVGGVPALVLELVDGASLDRVLRRTHLPLEVVDAVAVDLLTGLAAAHAAGLVHRDVKPANVLLAPSVDRVVAKLGDFGLAKGRKATLFDSLSTQPGAVIGTLAYMAPEQLADASEADARADVYAAAATLFEALTGERVIAGVDPLQGALGTDLISAHVKAATTFAPERMQAALLAALSRDPDRRPADGAAMLRVWLDGTDAETVRRKPWPARVVEIVRSLAQVPPVVVGFSGSGGRRRSLPPESEPLIGRRAELDALTHALSTGHRLVTLTGPVGAGKSRLALHLAWTVIGEAVWFCDVGGETSADAVAGRVARALGVAALGPDPVGAVGEVLAGRGRCLVVLDRLDPALGDATVGRWLVGAPSCAFVVTGTRSLSLPGERRVALGALSDDEGVELFLRRVRRTVPDFDPSGRQAQLRELIDLVDGLPGGIELVAARAAVLPLDAVERRLRDGDGARGTAAALEATWSALDPESQALLARLSVFGGGFDAEDAEQVAAPERADDVVDGLRQLLDQNLLRPVSEDGGGAPRFVAYRGARERAARHLRAIGDATATFRRHAAWFARLGDAEPLAAIDGPDGAAAWSRLLARSRDFALAVSRSLDEGWPDLAARAWCALHVVLNRTGPVTELVASAERILAHPDLPPALDPRVRSRLVDAWTGLGDFARARWLLEHARPQTEADRGVVDLQLGDVCQHEGRLEDALAHLRAAVARLEGVGDMLLLGNALRVLATVQSAGLDLQGAIDTELRALEAYERAGDPLRAAYVRINLACDLGELGRVDEAEQELLAALPVLRSHGDDRHLVTVGWNLANVASARGDLLGALARVEEASAAARANGFTMSAASIAVLHGHLLVCLGREDEAVGVCARAAAAIRDRGADAVRVQLLSNLAAALNLAGRHEEAGRAAAEARALDGDHGRFSANLHHELGRAARGRGDAAAAREELERALVLGRDHTLSIARSRLFAEVIGDLHDLGEPAADALARLDALGVGEGDDSFDGVVVDAIRARLLAADGRVAEAAATRARAEATARAHGWPDGALPWRHLARAAGSTG